VSGERVVGVDGCGGGWLAAVRDDDGIETAVYGAFSELLSDHADADRVLVDVPIGVPSDRYRRCDEQARTLLGSQWNAVFRTPVRRALFDPDGPPGTLRESRDEAKAYQEAATGTKISVQTWNIAPLIAELDAVVRERDGVPAGLREAHPEVTFWSLNGAKPVAYSKTTAAGRRLRLDLLESVLPGVRRAYDEARERYTAATASDDDVVDALALAAAASAATPDLVSLPFFDAENRDALALARASLDPGESIAYPGETAPQDEHGIPMEIAFPEPDPERWAPGRSE